MQNVSDEYLEEMRMPFRGKSSVKAQIGLINSDAQENASITSSFEGSEVHLYDNNGSGSVTSTENDGSITFSFGDFHELNIAGLTIVFNTIPSSITVTNGAKTGSYIVTDRNFIIDDGYTECAYLKIIPNEGKLSLKSITFGISVIFMDKQIISTYRENTVSHICNELPVKRFSITVDNQNHMFNEDNPYGYTKYLRQGQELVYEYGRELENGDIFTIKGGKVYIKSWSSDHSQAVFECEGLLSSLDGKFNKGQFYSEGISAYDLAIQVFEDAGITNYKIDNTLKSVMIKNPIPICEHREALRMIAGVSRCTLMEDRDGDIVITSGVKPSYIGNVEFKGARDYCIPSSIFVDNSKYNYADAEYDYAVVDGTMRFLPEKNEYLQVGFVSDDIADNNGNFSQETSIKLSFQNEYDLRKAIIKYSVIYPTSITVTCKLKGNVVDTQTLTVDSLSSTYVYRGKINEMTITFNSAQPNQRVHCGSVVLLGKQKYDLTYHELKSMPVASALEKVSQVNVHSYLTDYEKMDEGTSKSSSISVQQEYNADGGDTLNVEAIESNYGASISTINAFAGEQLVEFDKPYYNYKIEGGKIKESGSYYVIVEMDGSQDANIYAQPLVVSDNVFTMNLSEEGVQKEITNPLIGDSFTAKQVAEWVSRYYDDDVEYDIVYRGDPAIDANDLMYLQNDFVDNNEIRIVTETISTSTGMDFACTLKARRNSYLVGAILAKAVVGRIRAGVSSVDSESDD